MNIDVRVHDAKRIEVVCNAFSLWHGAKWPSLPSTPRSCAWSAARVQVQMPPWAQCCPRPPSESGAKRSADDSFGGWRRLGKDGKGGCCLESLLMQLGQLESLKKLPQMRLWPRCGDDEELHGGALIVPDVFDVQKLYRRHVPWPKVKRRTRASHTPLLCCVRWRSSQPTNNDAASRRHRTLRTFAKTGLFPPTASDGETLSDTLSAHTPCVSARRPACKGHYGSPPGDAPSTEPDQLTPVFFPANGYFP